MKELVGTKIEKVFVGKGESRLVFVGHPKSIAYETDADCCSETWFADITGVDALIGGTVTNIEDLYVNPVSDNRSRQDVDAFYGVKITTDKGVCDIVYRNSSNGYYGGNIAVSGDVSVDGFREITGDWSA